MPRFSPPSISIVGWGLKELWGGGGGGGGGGFREGGRGNLVIRKRACMYVLSNM